MLREDGSGITGSDRLDQENRLLAGVGWSGKSGTDGKRGTVEGLSHYRQFWDQSRASENRSRVYEDEEIVFATDFEGGNGRDLSRLGRDRYFLRLEPESGDHSYSEMAYYVCFGMRNKKEHSRLVRVLMEGRITGQTAWSAQEHMIVRRGDDWQQIDQACIYDVPDDPNSREIEILLPGAREDDSTLFMCNFHWWPYTEFLEYLETLRKKSARENPAVRIREIGRSYGGRGIYAVEIGPDDRNVPCLVHAQTPQPSEMGSLACRAMIDHLLSGKAGDIIRIFRICFIPMTNPDGAVLGLGVSDAQGRFPFFEAHLASAEDPSASPENTAVWRYLQEQRPWLFWDWHSNNWSRRPGHMLLRYRHELLKDEIKRSLGDQIEEELLKLPNTFHGNWTSRKEGLYQNSMGFQAESMLGAISCMIKQHDKFPLRLSLEHAVNCLDVACRLYKSHMK